MDKNKIIEAATKFVQKGQYDKAIKEYQKLLEVDAKDTRILQKVGELFQKKGDNGQAADYFLKVGESYAAEGFFLKAVAVFKQVLKLDDKRIDVNLKLAELYQQLGLMSDAMAQLQLVSGHYEKSGNGAASLDLLKRMVELDPDNIASRIKLAELYTRESMNTEAISEFQKAAQYLKRNNRIDDYIKVAERLVYLDPGNVELARELAQIYLAKQDTKRALAKLQTCFKADPRDVETLTLLAQAFHDLGQTSKTVSVYKELAKIYDEQDKVDEERGIWEKVRELAPDDPDAAKRLAPPSAASVGPAPQAYAAPTRPAQPERASAAAAAAPVAVGPEQIAKLLTETDVYVKYGLHDKALEHLKKVFAADPDNLEGHDKAYALAKVRSDHGRAEEELVRVIQLALAVGDYDRARARLQSLLESNPGHPEVAGFLEAIGQAPAAEEEIPAEMVEESLLIDSAEAEELSAEGAEVVEDEPQLVSGDDEAFVTAGDDELLAAADEPLVAEGAEDEALLAASDDEALSGGDDLVSDEPLGDELSGPGADHLATHAGTARPTSQPVDLLASDDEGLLVASGGDDEALVAADEELVSADDVVAGADDGPQSTVQYSGDEALFAVPEVEDLEPVEDPREHTSPLSASAGEDDFGDLNDVAVSPLVDDDDEDTAGAGDGATRVVNLADLAKADEHPTVAKMQVAPPEAIRIGARLGAAPPATSVTAPAVKIETQPKATVARPPSRPARVVEPEPEPVVEEADGDPAGDELEEASFFISQGDFDEARDILETVMLAYPGNARAQELLAELEAKQSGRGDAAPAADGDNSFDLAAELAEELGDAPAEAPAAPLNSGEGGFQISHEDVFAEFKKGVSKVVKPEDVETHYDLGVAYKEMGLLNDAVSEFEQAMAGAIGKAREIDCYLAIGACKRDIPDNAGAIEAYKKGLALPQVGVDAQKAMLYEIAAASEAVGNPNRALTNYMKIVSLDPKYRDAAAQVERLQSDGAEVEEEPAPAASKANGTPARAAADPKAAQPSAAKPASRKIGYV
jgi:pilus assembly protein FimV